MTNQNIIYLPYHLNHRATLLPQLILPYHDHGNLHTELL